ncbi:proton-conducting transporter transmembrane domain-containing protein [Paenibacillus sp. CAU 1782]
MNMLELAAAFVLLAAAALGIWSAAAGLRQEHAGALILLAGGVNAAFLLVPLGLSLRAGRLVAQGALLLHLAAFVLMLAGALLITEAIRGGAGHSKLNGFGGMYYRSPWLAAAMTTLLLSLAGLPVSGGFFGRLFILLEIASDGLYWVGAALLLAAAVSCYTLFGFIVQMYMRSYDGADNGGIKLSWPKRAMVGVCVAGSLVLGLFPGLLFF